MCISSRRSTEISTLKCKTSSKLSTKEKPCTSMKPKSGRGRERNKSRKPKFLSLRLQLSPPPATSTSTSTRRQKKLIDLFPSQSENKIDLEKDTYVANDHESSMEYLFSALDGGSTSLMALLNADTTSEEESATVAELAVAEESEEGRERESELFRTAMRRSRERDASEEKWVCISEVVEQKEEEVSSCEAEEAETGRPQIGGRLVLKLDYEEVMNAWCDKGPLFVEAAADQCAPHVTTPQTVPDFYDDFLFRDLTSKQGQLWTVPENTLGGPTDGENGEGKEGLQKGQREASVLRYKEKRQSRFFSKRIRYEVRKLNAEKRPRFKGRFVKRIKG